MNCPNVRWSKIWTSSWLAWRPRFLRFMTWRKFLKLQTTRHPSSDMNCDLLQLNIYKKMLRCPSIGNCLLMSSVGIWTSFHRSFLMILSKTICRHLIPIITSPSEACDAIGADWDSFEHHVQGPRSHQDRHHDWRVGQEPQESEAACVSSVWIKGLEVLVV